VIGSRGETTIDPRSIMNKDATIRGFRYTALTGNGFDSHGVTKDSKSGWLNPIVSVRLFLWEAAQAHHAVEEEKAFGKAVFTVSQRFNVCLMILGFCFRARQIGRLKTN
jgi:NADPH:quinone reductase-like Zn-dependent oxidoreductase